LILPNPGESAEPCLSNTTWGEFTPALELTCAQIFRRCRRSRAKSVESQGGRGWEKTAKLKNNLREAAKSKTKGGQRACEGKRGSKKKQKT